MTGQMGGHSPSNRAIEEVEIANQVKNFMPDKFIRESEFGVHNLFFIYQDNVMKPPSSCQSHFFEHFDIFNKTKGPCRSDLFSKCLFIIQNKFQSLAKLQSRPVHNWNLFDHLYHQVG